MERTFNSNVNASAADVLTDSISGMDTYDNFSERNALLSVAEVIPTSESMFSDFNITQHISNVEYSNASNDPANQIFPTLSPASSSHNKYLMNETPTLMSSHHQSHQLHSSNDPCAHVVHVLLCYHQGGEDLDFIRKAIESLVKKLKDRRMELDALISAVTSGGKQPSGCVTIHRSLDGRLQVAGRKGVPHVVYARIWRWPNVNKNELQKLPICATANDHPDLICINPFHYERVVSSGIGSLEISPLRMDHSSLIYDTNVGSCGPIGGTMTSDYAQQNFNYFKDQSLNSNIEFKSAGVEDATFSANLSGGNCGIGTGAEKLPFFMFGPNQQPSCVVSHLASGNTISNRQLPSFSQQPQNQTVFHYQDSQSQQCHMTSLSTSKQAMNYTSQLLAEESRDETTPKHTQDPYWATYMDNNRVAQKSDAHSCGQSNMGNNCDNNEGESKQVHNTFGAQRYNNLRYNLDQVRIPFIMPPEHWCTIVYYELDTQVGEAFKVPQGLTEVIVDGGLNPSAGRSGRFCLGALSNVHRTEASEKARIHIGKGIKLKTTADGSVYLQCMSHKGVFVRSYFLDFEHSLIYGSTVHKFCSGAEKKLFDLRWAFAEMCEQRESAQMAVVAQAYAVAGIVQRVAPSLIERAGIGVDDLRRVCCTIAISFVKGWGSGYNRSSIKETPCWIEIHLHRPLQLLNFLLQKTEQ